MYELNQLAQNTFAIECPARMGLYRAAGGEGWLIDSGSDKDAAKKVLKILNTEGWRLAGVMCTHSHADHTGGCALLQERTGCRVFAPGAEYAFARWPHLEPSLLYGGYPFRALRTKFLQAKPCEAELLTPDVLPNGLQMFPLPGHFLDMTGFRTADGVEFLADCLSGEDILKKYPVAFLYDVKAALATLAKVEQRKAALFVPAHAPVTQDIAPLARLNRQTIEQVADLLVSMAEEPKSAEEIIARVFDHFGLAMDVTQNLLVGSTVRSYLAYLADEGRVTPLVQNNRLCFAAQKQE